MNDWLRQSQKTLTLMSTIHVQFMPQSRHSSRLTSGTGDKGENVIGSPYVTRDHKTAGANRHSSA